MKDTMKAKAKVYRGIEFIHLAELPAKQQLLLEHSSNPERIKILIDGKVVGDCIQYEKYSNWYHTVYQQSVPADSKANHEKLFNQVIAASKE